MSLKLTTRRAAAAAGGGPHCGSLSPTRVGREPRASPSRRPERGAPGAGGGVHCSLVLYVVDSGEGARARRGGGARSRSAVCLGVLTPLDRDTAHASRGVCSQQCRARRPWRLGLGCGECVTLIKLSVDRYYGLYFARAQLFTPSAPRFPARSTLSWAPRPLPDPRVVEDPLVRRLHSISFVTC